MQALEKKTIIKAVRMEVYNTCSGTPDAATHHVSHLRGVRGSVPEVDCTIPSAEGYNRKWICKCILMH